MDISDVLSLSGSQGKFQVAVSNGSVLVMPITQAARAFESQPIAPSYHPPHPHTSVGGGGGELFANTVVHGGDDALGLSSADESLADLQQAESEGEEEEHTLRNHLSGEQTKLEFMAALGLVPPAILEEIQRRQQLCRAEYGNWWDRLHSTDFCLVAKSDRALSNVQAVAEEMNLDLLSPVGGDVTQVAAGPDADSLVEQITYLTSWPASTSTPAPPHTITPSLHTAQPLVGAGHTVEVMTSRPPQMEQLMGLVADKQSHMVAEEHALQATLQQLTAGGSFMLPRH